MKRQLDFGLLIVILSSASLWACGTAPATDVTGPILDESEVKALAVDQFIGSGGSGKGKFSVYLRDAATNQDLGCAGQAQGFDQLAAGTYYGSLNIDLTTVTSDQRPSSSARFQIVVVEKDSDDCPAPVATTDTIVGKTAELTFDDLLGKPLWTTNGLAAVTLRVRINSAVAIPSMAPALKSGLAIDQLFFDNGSDGEKKSRYYVFAERMIGEKSVQECQVDDSSLSHIQYGKITYAALGIPLSCFDATDPGFADTQLKISLWIQQGKGPALVGETAVVTAREAIGEKLPFTNGTGFVKLRNVEAVPFAATVIRLEELTSLIASSLSYVLTPTFQPTVELHVIPTNASYSVACAGSAQGLTGVSQPGTYTGLSAQLVALTGQQELFGWEKVVIELIERTDGKSCPAPVTNAPTVLAQTTALTPAALSGRNFTFLNGGGTVAFTFSSGSTGQGVRSSGTNTINGTSSETTSGGSHASTSSAGSGSDPAASTNSPTSSSGSCN